MRHFWNWVKNEDATRTLYLEGVIAEESWFADDVTPAMFKEELYSGDGPITLHINSPGGDCFAASQIYTIGQLDLAPLRKPVPQDILGDPPCHISSTSVNLCWIFSRESAASMVTCATICIDNNFSTS